METETVTEIKVTQIPTGLTREEFLAWFDAQMESSKEDSE